MKEILKVCWDIVILKYDDALKNGFVSLKKGTRTYVQKNQSSRPKHSI